MEGQYWIHPDGWLYFGDHIAGARLASEEEQLSHWRAIDQQVDSTPDIA